MARSAKNTAWNEVFALVLLGVGTLLFLALISYSPKDLPSWVWFSKVSTPNSPAQNFIGPLGAIVAGFCYFMIGGASYLLAVVLLGFRRGEVVSRAAARLAARWLDRALRRLRGVPAASANAVSARLAFRLQYPGAGRLGRLLLRAPCLRAHDGRGRSIILLSGIYVTSIILMTGLRPIHIVRQTVAGDPARHRQFSRMAAASAACSGPTSKVSSRSASVNWRSSSARSRSS